MVRTPVLTPEKERSAAAKSAAADPQANDRCPACGAELAADQEWCLECGAAVTQIYAPPDWKIGLAIVLGVIAVVAIIATVLWP
jgi:uncharacterized OB-fold protein